MKKKYQRTKHLPISPKRGDDDKVLNDDSCFYYRHVTAYIKMDGENTTIAHDYSHARSLDSTHDTEDRRWLEAWRLATFTEHKYENLKFCGESMFYKHTVDYGELEHPFYLFSIWSADGNTCLPASSTSLAAQLLKIPTPHIIFQGVYDLPKIVELFEAYKATNPAEGFVIRLTDSFKAEDFQTSVAKYVCADFEIPNEHWRKSPLLINKFKGVSSPWELL